MRVWVVATVKPLARAKRRLRDPELSVPHDRLVLAMAQDTVAAALASSEVAGVLVVTDDPLVRRATAELGAQVAEDAPAAGLNAALTHGAAVVGGHRWRAALAADLPALRPAELGAALRVATADPHRRAFVADWAGTGTTLLVAPPGVALGPRFGPGSAAAHAASGARRLDRDGDRPWPSLCRDVDTPADLAQAGRLGLGPYTAGVYGDFRRRADVEG